MVHNAVKRGNDMPDKGSAITVFYSWQKNTPSSINRNFIEEALKKAIKKAGKDYEVQAAIRDKELVIDRDTAGVPGTPPITQTIFEKISQCGIFIADLTFVGKTEMEKPIPNPNVLIEYGYAIKSVNYSRIIAVMNTAFGEPTEGNMPFNLRHHRFPIQYKLREDNKEDGLTRVKQLLIADFTKAIVDIIGAGLLDDSQGKTLSVEETQPTTNPSTFLQPEEKVGFYEDRPLYIPEGPRMFLRIIPKRHSVDIDSPKKALELVKSGGLHSMGLVVSGFSYSRNQYGAIVFNNEDSSATNVTQLFKNGELWGIDSRNIGKNPNFEKEYGFNFIHYERFKEVFVFTLENYLKFASETSKLVLPLRLVAGATDIEKYKITAPDGFQFNGFMKCSGLAVENQIIYESSIDDYSTSTEAILLPFLRKFYDHFGLTLPEKESTK